MRCLWTIAAAYETVSTVVTLAAVATCEIRIWAEVEVLVDTILFAFVIIIDQE